MLKKHLFFGYLRISDSTGKGLLDAFLEKATELQLELSDCRGQSYDNGANMKGKHSGVQARMLDINPKAVYVPCANHTLNLVVVDSQGRIKAGADGAAAPGPPKNRPTTIPSQRSLKSYSYDHFQKIVKV